MNDDTTEAAAIDISDSVSVTLTKKGYQVLGRGETVTVDTFEEAADIAFDRINS